MTENAKSIIKAELIAPCGMNCAICMGRLLREKTNAQVVEEIMTISLKIVLNV